MVRAADFGSHLVSVILPESRSTDRVVNRTFRMRDVQTGRLFYVQK
jgi:hypothetical protein